MCTGIACVHYMILIRLKTSTTLIGRQLRTAGMPRIAVGDAANGSHRAGDQHEGCVKSLRREDTMQMVSALLLPHGLSERQGPACGSSGD